MDGGHPACLLIGPPHDSSGAHLTGPFPRLDRLGFPRSPPKPAERTPKPRT
ncbi:Hypothetical predicted protein [Pelobates cultripes]|uniref:Uncharacterized protein n=1 Tax=Pelobates cultripes TaxID=61616 RepID=A0AAD1T078_PELCU|nr:Hypothetical predicted protein [Pelobates cultripes]